MGASYAAPVGVNPMRVLIKFHGFTLFARYEHTRREPLPMTEPKAITKNYNLEQTDSLSHCPNATPMLPATTIIENQAGATLPCQPRRAGLPRCSLPNNYYQARPERRSERGGRRERR